MNNPLKSSMYILRPVSKIPENIELPNNMYKLRKIQSVGEPSKSDTDILRGIEDKSSSGDVTELEKRWDRVLEQLRDLKAQLTEIKNSVPALPNFALATTPKLNLPNQLQALDGAVINADLNSPPYSLLLIQNRYKDYVNLNISCHVHSTVVSDCMSVKDFDRSSYQTEGGEGGAPRVNIYLIWKQGLLDMQLVVNPCKQISILGEVNILRYLARLGLNALDYNDNDTSNLQIDTLLDTCHRLVHVRTAKERTSIVRNLNAKLGKSSYFGGNDINVSDIAAWSALKRTQLTSNTELSQNMTKWLARIDSLLN